MLHPPKKTVKRRKSRAGLWIALAAALCLSLALVLLLPRIRAAVPGSRTQMTVTTVSQRVFETTDPNRLESVTIRPGEGQSYTLVMHNGALMLEENGELLDLNDTYAEEILSTVTEIVGQVVVAEDWTELEEQLEEMGLAAPRASAVIRCNDGSESVLELGADVPNTTYAYCRWSGSPAIYLCDAGVVDALTLTRNRLLPVEQPEIIAGLLDEVVIENANDRCRLTFTDGAYGRMEEPISYPLDAGAASNLLTALENFRLGTLEGAVTEQNRAAYGFDEPLCTVEIAQSAGVVSEVDESGQLVSRLREKQEIRFVIGREEGEYFYTCLYEGNCYLVSRFLAQKLVGVKRSELLSRNPLDVGDLAVRNVYIQTAEGTVDVQAVRVERVLPNNELEVDAQGNVAYDTFVTRNGKESTAELLDELISRMDAFTILSDVPPAFSPSGEPAWSVVIQTETGLVRTVEAWKMDLFTEGIEVDGVMLHCAHADAIDVLTEGLTENTAARDR